MNLKVLATAIFLSIFGHSAGALQIDYDNEDYSVLRDGEGSKGRSQGQIIIQDGRVFHKVNGGRWKSAPVNGEESFSVSCSKNFGTVIEMCSDGQSRESSAEIEAKQIDKGKASSSVSDQEISFVEISTSTGTGQMLDGRNLDSRSRYALQVTVSIKGSSCMVLSRNIHVTDLDTGEVSYSSSMLRNVKCKMTK